MKHWSTLLTAAVIVLWASLALSQTRPALPGTSEPIRLATPRIAPLSPDQWTEHHRALVDAHAPGGRVGNGLGTLLHVPELAEAILPFVEFLRDESSLEPRYQALLGLRTAWVTQNHYLWARFAGFGREAGLTRDDLRRVARGPDGNE